MDPIDIARQGQIESDMVKHITDAIRSTLAWQVGSDAARKLSTLRFITQSFQRHIHRLMTLEEYDGYMGLVVDTCPRLSKTVDQLRREHDQLQVRTNRIVHDLERVHPENHTRLGRISTNLLALLDELDAHSKREVDVLQEALERDTGGEG